MHLTSNTSRSIPNLSLDELIAINDEILALVRAGVPLGRGLLGLGRDLPGRLSKTVTVIGERMEAGETLPEVLSRNSDQFPPVYRAVVEAGARAGRLPVALEGLATTTRRFAELRRVIGLALLYPLLILIGVCLLLALLVPRVIESVVIAFEVQRVEDNMQLARLQSTLESLEPWILMLPIVAVFVAGCWWSMSGRAMAAQPGILAHPLQWVPWLGPMVRFGRLATFCEVLGLLQQQQVPLAKALVLSADATGDPGIRSDARRLASQLDRGETPVASSANRFGVPPSLVWLMQGNTGCGDVSQAFGHCAETYYRRSCYLGDWLRVYLPMLLTVVIGGTATVVYAGVVLIPWFYLLRQLGNDW